MANLSRRNVLKFASATGAVFAGAIAVDRGGPSPAGAAGSPDSFTAASSAVGGDDGETGREPGIQRIVAVSEVTGGGQKIYGIAVEYDAPVDAGSLAPGSFTASVFPAAEGYFPGMPDGPDKNATSAAAGRRAVAAIYTNAAPALRPGRTSAAGTYVIVEFAHDSDLSSPTTDSEKVSLSQDQDVRTADGRIHAANPKVWTNTGRRGLNVVIRGVDDWEQNHWWWDDSRSATLEYSIYLPKSFLAEGGENRAYPLVIAITHSGTAYDGTCKQTLTEQVIASIWGMPEEQAKHECVVVTPRYERTTMNDYWEHTHDVENTYRLVESLLENAWNFGNPNLPDRAGKVLKIDRKRVYCTGWSMGAMTSLWMMAKHPETFAAGLIMAGQQRPADVVDLARQQVLIITGEDDTKATPWTDKCVPVWEKAGAKVTRPEKLLDPKLIFPVANQQALSDEIDGYLGQGGNITYLTFAETDHMESARKFFHIQAARDWLFRQALP